MPPSNVPPTPEKTSRWWILIAVCVVIIVAVAAVLILWPQKLSSFLSGRLGASAQDQRAALLKASQPAGEPAIDNSDILASASETIPAETTPEGEIQRIQLLNLIILVCDFYCCFCGKKSRI